MGSKIRVVAAGLNVGAEFNAAEVNGGATVGTYLLINAIIPANSIITRFSAKVYKLLASAGACTISWGLKDLETGTVVVNSLSVAKTFTAYNSTSLSNWPNIAGVNFNTTPLGVSNPSQIVIAIGGATLTSGGLSGVVTYIERVGSIYNA